MDISQLQWNVMASPAQPVLKRCSVSVLRLRKVSDHTPDLYRLKIPGPCFHPDKTLIRPENGFTLLAIHSLTRQLGREKITQERV